MADTDTRRGPRIAIAGAGFSGAVIARELAERGGCRVVVFESRDHVAGNCHTARDPWSGVLLHIYGAHVFHTSHQHVWDYVRRFATFRPFTTRFKAVTRRGVFSLPINLLTINQFFGKVLGPREARAFIESLADTSIVAPRNLEEQALRHVGRELYEAFFRDYTTKQWGVDPTELPASILERLPVRFDYDDDYFDDTYQGIPEQGYTALVARILDHPGVELRLGERFEPAGACEFDHLFYSGPLDGFFEHRLGRLGYRSLRFERIESEGDYQGGPVVTYCQPEVPFVRIYEHGHFAPWERHRRSVAYRQFAKPAEPADIPYYPLRLVADHQRLADYVALAQELRHVTFVGRLGTYRYLDMHVVIAEALETARRFLAHDPVAEPFPVFAHSPTAPSR